MNYKILLPPIVQDGELLWDTISLSQTDATPLLNLRIIRPLLDSEAEAPSEEISSDTKLDVNFASFDELLELEHVGEATATRIISSRPYETLEQVQAATGLNDSKWKKLESQLTV